MAVDSYRDVLDRYLNHEEAKSLAPDGRPVQGGTRGVLQRRPVSALHSPIVIGKEGNKLDDRLHGVVLSVADYPNTYNDSREQIWSELIAPILRDMPLQSIASKTGLSERTLRNVRNGLATPKRNSLVLLAWAAVEFAQERLRQSGVEIEEFSAAVIRHDIIVARSESMPWRCSGSIR